MGTIKDTEKRKGKPRLQPVEPHRADGKLVHSNSLIKEIEKERYKLSAYFENLPAMAYNISFDGIIADCNQRVVKTLGYDNKTDLIGKPLLKTIYAPSCRDKANRLFEQWKKEGVIRNEEMQVITKDGRVIDVLLNVDTIIDHNGEAVHSLSTQLNITERKQAEESLQESERRLRITAERTGQLLYSFNPKTGKVKWAGAIEEVSGYTNEEYQLFDVHDWAEHIHPDDREMVLKAVDEAVEAKTKFNAQYRLRRKDGSYIFVQEHGVFLSDSENATYPIVGTITNITERRVAEEKMAEYQMQLKSLASQLALSEERYRRKTAAELHDEVGQLLAYARLQVNTARKYKSVPELMARLDDASKSILRAIEDIHDLSFDLSSPVLRLSGLEAAIDELVEERLSKEHNIRTEVVDDGQEKPLDEDTKAIVFRTVRELVTNIVKHARANCVKIVTERCDGQLRVVVEDDGVGFDVAKASNMATQRKAFGLFSVKEQLGALGGQFDIQSEPGKGTKATLTVPLQQQ